MRGMGIRAEAMGVGRKGKSGGGEGKGRTLADDSRSREAFIQGEDVLEQ